MLYSRSRLVSQIKHSLSFIWGRGEHNDGSNLMFLHLSNILIVYNHISRSILKVKTDKHCHVVDEDMGFPGHLTRVISLEDYKETTWKDFS